MKVIRTDSSSASRDTDTINEGQFTAWVPEQKWWAHRLEQLSLAIERPVNRLSQTTQLNPFYHTGTISLFLLTLVVSSGFFLFVFFQYGYDASYEAVVRLESQPIGRLTRAVHRYASGALLVTTLLHAIRMLFMERFRGPRWLAWMSGHVMVGLIWIAGVTGYWLLQDVRAQQLNRRFVDFVDRVTPWGDRLRIWLIHLEGEGSWLYLFFILVVHVMATLAIAGFFYLHVSRLKRAKLFPELHWLIGLGSVMLIGSILFPLGVLPQGSPSILPVTFRFDPIFLFFLPNQVGWLIWLALFLVGLGLTGLPWLSRPRKPLPKVSVIESRCTGCTRCANDCPYGALQMIDLEAGAAHPYLAIADPTLCVSCGICVGSCLDDAITLGDADPADLRQLVKDRIAHATQRAEAGGDPDIELVFTCGRFANQGAAPYLNWQVEQVEATHQLLEVVPVPCAGSISPDLLIYALDHGAAEVRLVGCPPDDCTNREGNLIEEQRLTRERPPKLKRAYANVPISAVWTSPDRFDDALQEDVYAKESNWLESRRLFEQLSWRNFLPAFSLFAIVMLIQIGLSAVPMRATAAGMVQVEIVLPDIGPVYPAGGPEDLYRLMLEIDGEISEIYQFNGAQFYDDRPAPFYHTVDITPGRHVLHLYLLREGEERPHTVAKAWVDTESYQVMRLFDQRSRPLHGH